MEMVMYYIGDDALPVPFRPNRPLLSKAGMLEELIEHDQLNIERAAGRVFRDFEEGPLEFKPILFVAASFCTAATTIAQQGRKWQSVK